MVVVGEVDGLSAVELLLAHVLVVDLGQVGEVVQEVLAGEAGADAVADAPARAAAGA